MSKLTLRTMGDGLWSDRAAQVEVTDIDLAWVNEDRTFGELKVYFTDDSWDVEQDGLIYTDGQFIAELNMYLDEQGIPDAQYSEQGMQGDDYVSLDVDGEFIAAWEEKYSVQV